MAYKSQVTNKYIGAGFKGAPKSNRNPASTELGQIVSALKNDLSPAVQKWAEVNILKQKDEATKKVQKMYLEGKTSEQINDEILKGDHPDLTHKYTEAVVNGQLGRINGYEVMNTINENMGDYRPREESLETFWQKYLPNFDEKGKFFTEGFAAVFTEYKAKALSKDASERAIFRENQKVNGVVNSVITDYQLNGFKEGKMWQLIESFGAPLPFEGEGKNYFMSNAAKNKSAFIIADSLVKTAKDEKQLDDVLAFLDEDRGGKYNLKSLGETYDAQEIAKLRARIETKRESLKSNEYNAWVRNKTKKGHELLQDYNAYKYGGTLSDGTVIDRNVAIAGEDNINYYDDKAEEVFAEAKDFDITLASTIQTLDSNIDNRNRDKERLEALMLGVQQGLWVDNPTGLARAIADAGGNLSDWTTIGNQNWTVKTRVESGQGLFPFQTENFWTNSANRLTKIMDTDTAIIKIAPNAAERMMITNTVIQEYENQVMAWYADPQNAEPSKTANGGKDWIEWNRERVKFRNETVNDLLATYKTEAYYKKAKSLIEQGDTNSLSTLIASDVTKDVIEKAFDTTITTVTNQMSKSKQTFENFKEESARLLTPISELPQFKAMLNNVKNNLAKAGIINIDDAELTKMLLEKIGLNDADVDLEAVKDQFISNTNTVIEQGFDKSFPTLVEDNPLTFWTDEAKAQLKSPEMASFLQDIMGELTGMGNDFNPLILLQLDDVYIDRIAQAINADADVFRTALENAYPQLKGKL
jgi:hypothetical protein|tara:strand:+ start:198 stop:2468 length:2271 start_codon:yes stop_codon:yes gene_type:complete